MEFKFCGLNLQHQNLSFWEVNTFRVGSCCGLAVSTKFMRWTPIQSSRVDKEVVSLWRLACSTCLRHGSGLLWVWIFLLYLCSCCGMLPLCYNPQEDPSQGGASPLWDVSASRTLSQVSFCLIINYPAGGILIAAENGSRQWLTRIRMKLWSS